MSIATAIAALSPTTWWKLDEASGTAAADSSGGSITGTYSGSRCMASPGPEAGTFSVALTNVDGLVSWSGTPPSNTSSNVSIMVWAAIYNAHPFSGGNGLIAYAGQTGANGLGPVTDTAGNFLVLHGGHGSSQTGFRSLDTLWHQFVVTNDGSNTVRFYLDGIATSLGGLAYSAPVNYAVGNVLIGQFAHFATWFGTTLTGTQINGVFTARSSPQESPGSCVIPPGPDVAGTIVSQCCIDQTNLLNQILASVRKDY